MSKTQRRKRQCRLFTTHSLLLMCKTIFLLLTALCLLAHVQAQSPLPTENAMNATGNTLSGGGTIYTYSVGEVVAFSLSNPCSFTQGVVQPSKWTVVSVAEAFD